MFSIRYSDTETHTVSLNPMPTEVDYPERFAGTVMTSVDGNVIIQRPMRDSRVRKWVFLGWGTQEPYVTQWTLLESLVSSSRVRAGLSPTVAIWEDETHQGFDRLDAEGEKVYTTVKFTQASRVVHGAGPVRYESTLEFYIVDSDYTSF